MNLHAIASPLIGVVNPNQLVQVQISTGQATNADGTQTPGYATPGVITASIGGTFTASIPDPVNAPTTLNVSAVLTGSLQATDVVSGTDGTNALPAGTTIVQQLGGTPGGVGTYQLSVGATLGACTVTSASTVANVSAVAQGTLQPGQALGGAGPLLPGTALTGQLSGTPGGPGLYSVTQQQTVPAQAMTTSLAIVMQVQAMSGGDLRHMDMLNLQGSHRTVYSSYNLRGGVRVALRGGDLLTLPDGSVWLVNQNQEPFFSTAGWNKVIITLQDGA